MERLNIKGCIFDLDGTLANTLDSIASFGNATLKSFGFTEIPTGKYRKMVGNGAELLIKRMLKEVGADLSDEEEKLFRLEYDRRYAENPLYLVNTYPGLPGVLEDLKNSGLKLGVLSNKPDDMAKAVVEGLFGGLFDLIFGALPGVPKKPDPAAALKMAGLLGLSPAQMLYVGDSGVDMQTAVNAGMIPCGVLWGFRDLDELLSCGARFTVKEPAELRSLLL